MKNHLKKLLITFTLIIGLCASMLATPAAAAEIPEDPISVSASNTKKIELNNDDVLFYVGGVYNLRLQNATAKNVKWRTSNKAIATVNSKGRVTAKKVGKCYIIAKYKGKQYKCKATVLSDNGFVKTWCKMIAKKIKKGKRNKSPYNQVLSATSFVAKNFDYGSAKMSRGELTAEVLANYLRHEHLPDCTLLSENARCQLNDGTLSEAGNFIRQDHNESQAA